MPGDLRKIRRTAAAVLVVFLIGPVSAPVAAQLVDPTRPANFRAVVPTDDVRPAPEGGWVLTGIRIGSRGASARLNGETVQVGTTIGQAEVVTIERDKVVLRGKDDLITLRLYAGINKIKRVGKH